MTGLQYQIGVFTSLALTCMDYLQLDIKQIKMHTVFQAVDRSDKSWEYIQDLLSQLQNSPID